MSGFIICPECSKDLGKLTAIYVLARKSLNKETVIEGKHKDYAPSLRNFNTKHMCTYEEILNALSIKNECCRMHMLGLSLLNAEYK